MITNIKSAVFTVADAYEIFGVEPGLLSEVMTAGLSRGGDFCELYFQYRHESNLWLDDHLIRSGNAKILRGVGVRVLKGDQTGFSHTAVLDRKSLLSAARTAALVADSGIAGRPQPISSLFFPVNSFYPGGSASNDREALRDWLIALDERIYGIDSRVIKANCYARVNHEKIFIVNSEGLAACDDRPEFCVDANCIAEQKGRREENGYGYAIRQNQSQLMTAGLLEEVATETVERTVKLFEAVEAFGGEMPLVLASGEGGILVHEAMGHGFEADFIRKGMSIFAGRLGEMCASPDVTIVDSGILLEQWGSLNFDDEGYPGEETVLVENGRLTSWIHDRLSARHFGCEPTGNGRRESYQFLPLPRMRTTYLRNGRHAKEEIIASIRKGIYAEQFTNGQVNIGPGDFTFYMKSGWLIEDGKLTRPIKDVNIIGNGPKVLAEIEMVGDDLQIFHRPGMCGKYGQSVPVSFGMPTLKVKSITVGGRN